jgi:transcriptional regulator with XRE-family HTH domain
MTNRTVRGEIDLNAEIDALPEAERAAIDRRAAELDREVRVLKEIRHLAAKSQQDVAASLGIAQPSVSKMESQVDMYLSTLRAYVEALGGSLTLRIQFPDRDPIEVRDLADLSGRNADAEPSTDRADGPDEPVPAPAAPAHIADTKRTGE